MLWPYLKALSSLNSRVVIHVREHWPIGENRLQFNMIRKYLELYSDQIVAINDVSKFIVNVNNKTTVVYDPFNLGKSKPSKLVSSSENGFVKIVFVGGVQRIKGAHEVVRAFTENLMAKNLILTFYGLETLSTDFSGFKGIVKRVLGLFGYLSYSDKLKELIAKDDRIVIKPYSSNMTEVINNSDLLITYPTIPHALLPIAEFLSLGVPVVTALTEEAIEYSCKSDGVAYFKMNDYQEFTEVLVDTVSRLDFFKECATLGSTPICSKFDKELNMIKLNNAYKNVLNMGI
jgi:glycosyltransferase involved in cell wall biosynthesis